MGECCREETCTEHPAEVPDVLLGVSKMWWRSVCTHECIHTLTHAHTHAYGSLLCRLVMGAGEGQSQRSWDICFQREIYEWEKLVSTSDELG